MERIQAAIQKAKEQRGTGPIPAADAGIFAPSAPGRREVASGLAWDVLPVFDPDPELMARHRIVTFADTDPAHATFDMLRTKVLRMMRQGGWTSLGITSPTAGCGKTMTSLNLAFSLAHQPDLRTVLVDLDLRRPAVARDIGLDVAQSMAGVLQGTRAVAENFVRYGENLAIGTNAAPVRNSSELLLNAATAQGVAAIKTAFAPDVLLYDLPPMLMSDDTMAFLPHLDCVLLVAGAGKSSLDDVEACENDLREQTNLLGVTLNMCRYMGESYGYYGPPS
jgi:Mrp family chromosome partitioning ATPase